MKTVFCDESGFTGENLWHVDQPHFVYAAVSVPEDEAVDIVESTRREFSIRAAELHAAQLMRRDSGKRALMSIVELLVPRSAVVVFHKRYSLAAKMFEYLIEPAISDESSIFYDIGFHKFVANGLYLRSCVSPQRRRRRSLTFRI